MSVTATYVSTSSCTVSTNMVDEFPVNQPVQFYCGAADGIKNASIESATYNIGSGLTTLTLDNDVLTTNLESLLYSFFSPQAKIIEKYLCLDPSKIMYVTGSLGSDDNSGYHPREGFENIATGIASLPDGGILRVAHGTFTEVGLDFDVPSGTLWTSHGTVIDPVSGTALTMSGAFSKHICPGGALKVSPAAAATAVLVSGAGVRIDDIQSYCNHAGAIGFDITGTGVHGNNLACADPLTAAYKIQGDKIVLHDCLNGSTAADTSIGMWITNSCDKFRATRCATQGNATAGWQVDAGCTNGAINNCSSGGGDGAKLDNGEAFTWPAFSFDSHITNLTTFSGATTEYNFFKLTGGVRLKNYHAHIETVIPAVACNLYLQLFSAGGTEDITDAPGVDISGAVVGAGLIRNGPATDALALANPDGAPKMVENASYRKPATEVDIYADDTNPTYLRAVLSAAQASGAIHHHCEYEPLTDDGFLEPV